MTDDELRKKIYRSVKFDLGDVNAYGHPPSFGWPGDYVSDLRACRTRLLDLLPPADDGEPITADWLRAVGFVGADDWLEISGGGYELTKGNRWILSEKSPLELDVVYMPDMPTRGHVRRLCAALGITLTEHTHETGVDRR